MVELMDSHHVAAVDPTEGRMLRLAVNVLPWLVVEHGQNPPSWRADSLAKELASSLESVAPSASTYLRTFSENRADFIEGVVNGLVSGGLFEHRDLVDTCAKQIYGAVHTSNVKWTKMAFAVTREMIIRGSTQVANEFVDTIKFAVGISFDDSAVRASMRNKLSIETLHDLKEGAQHVLDAVVVAHVREERGDVLGLLQPADPNSTSGRARPEWILLQLVNGFDL